MFLRLNVSGDVCGSERKRFWRMRNVFECCYMLCFCDVLELITDKQGENKYIVAGVADDQEWVRVLVDAKVVLNVNR